MVVAGLRSQLLTFMHSSTRMLLHLHACMCTQRHMLQLDFFCRYLTTPRIKKPRPITHLLESTSAPFCLQINQPPFYPQLLQTANQAHFCIVYYFAVLKFIIMQSYRMLTLNLTFFTQYLQVRFICVPEGIIAHASSLLCSILLCDAPAVCFSNSW